MGAVALLTYAYPDSGCMRRTNIELNERLFYRMIVPVACALITLPSLFLGFFMDDFMQLLALEEAPLQSMMTKSNLFEFANGDPEKMKLHTDTGFLPWWSLSTLKISFFRPLSTLLMNWDHALFGLNPAGYHFHSVLWFLALVAIACTLFRSTLNRGAAAVASLIFAVDDAHVMPLAWVANRNAVIATCLGALTLFFHMRARNASSRSKNATWYLLALLSLCAGLGASEAAVAMGAYLVAYEVALRDDPLWHRARALLPYAAIAVIYVLIASAHGAGVHGSGAYIDPRADLAGWLGVLPRRLAMLVACATTNAPIGLSMIIADARPWFIGVGGLGLIATAVVLKHAHGTSDQSERRALRFWLLGAGLALIPVASTFPSARLLTPASLGIAGMFGQAIAHMFSLGKKRSQLEALRPKYVLVVAAILAFFQLPGAALMSGLHYQRLFSISERANASSQRMALSQTQARQALAVVVVSADPVTGFYWSAQRYFSGKPWPRKRATLSAAPLTHVISRTAVNTLEMEVRGGQMFSALSEHLLRGTQYTVKPGQTFHNGELTTTILKTDAGLPTRVHHTFLHDLDSEAYVFYAWNGHTYGVIDLPAIGQSLRLERTLGVLE